MHRREKTMTLKMSFGVGMLAFATLVAGLVDVQTAADKPVPVNVSNFIRAETDL